MAPVPSRREIPKFIFSELLLEDNSSYTWLGVLYKKKNIYIYIYISPTTQRCSTNAIAKMFSMPYVCITIGWTCQHPTRKNSSEKAEVDDAGAYRSRQKIDAKRMLFIHSWRTMKGRCGRNKNKNTGLLN